MWTFLENELIVLFLVDQFIGFSNGCVLGLKYISKLSVPTTTMWAYSNNV